MELQTHFSCRESGSGRLLRLSLETVDDMLPEVLRAFGSVPKRGAEAGGFLLGRMSAEAIEIEAAEFVPCEHRLGPSYLFTGDDEAAFAAALQTPRSLQVVGYFRSNTRDEVTPDSADRELLQRYFPTQSQRLLLIRPFATKVSQAQFYRLDNDRFTASGDEFPYSRKLLGGGGRVRRVDVAVVASDIESDVASEIESYVESDVLSDSDSDSDRAHPPQAREEQNRPAPQPPSRKSLLAATIVLSVALGWAAGYFVARAVPGPPQAEMFGLDLRVEPRDADLRVTWNGSAGALRTALRGRLRIAEGAATRTVPLDLEQLRRGYVIYRNPAETVRFNLEVDEIAETTVSQASEFTLPGPP